MTGDRSIGSSGEPALSVSSKFARRFKVARVCGGGNMFVEMSDKLSVCRLSIPRLQPWAEALVASAHRQTKVCRTQPAIVERLFPFARARFRNLLKCRS